MLTCMKNVNLFKDMNYIKNDDQSEGLPFRMIII